MNTAAAITNDDNTTLSRLNPKILEFISYAVWFGVSCYCTKKYVATHQNDLMHFVYITLVVSILNSAMGLTEIFREDVMYSMRTLLEIFQVCLALPCLTTEVWLKHNVAQKEIAYLHAIIGLIPTYIFLFQHYTRRDVIDLVVILNLISLGFIGILYNNLYAVGAAIMMFLAYCVFDYKSEIAFQAPSRQIFNYCIALFVLCGSEAVI